MSFDKPLSPKRPELNEAQVEVARNTLKAKALECAEAISRAISQGDRKESVTLAHTFLKLQDYSDYELEAMARAYALVGFPKIMNDDTDTLGLYTSSHFFHPNRGWIHLDENIISNEKEPHLNRFLAAYRREEAILRPINAQDYSYSMQDYNYSLPNHFASPILDSETEKPLNNEPKKADGWE